jgi:hypothetical protein
MGLGHRNNLQETWNRVWIIVVITGASWDAPLVEGIQNVQLPYSKVSMHGDT